MNPNYHNPVAITFGAGMLERLPQVIGERKAVLVTFPEAEGFGLTGRVRELLGARLVAVEPDTVPNPDVASLTGMYERFWQQHADADVVLGIGGGSALDTAKALMVGTPSGKFAELVQLLATGKPFTPERVKPLITVPTTAGTGSEVTPWATVWAADTGFMFRRSAICAPPIRTMSGG